MQNGSWALFVCQPLVTKVTAIEPNFRTDCFMLFFFIEGASTFFPIRIARQSRWNQEQMLFSEITAMLYDLPLDIYHLTLDYQ
mgnify:CR=1 FL=1